MLLLNWKILKVFLLHVYLTQVDGSTHWMVTEDGKIQQQLESPFAMKQPHDLVAFMRQERDYTNLKSFKETLLKEQEAIETNEDKDTDLESRHYITDVDCKAAGKKLPEFDLFISSVLPLDNKDIEVEDHISIEPVTKLREPNCSAVFDLPYSIHSYDHLLGVQERDQLDPQSMPGLKTSLPFLEDPVAAATAIHDALDKNATSWVLYNLASFYWRMQGNPSAAIECIRRALHFSPNNNSKDVALVNLANILHKARYSQNASVVMLHALQVSDGYAINYFSLANIYAVLGEYNESIYYYEKTLDEQSDFEAAKPRLAAVKCQLKLQEKLENQHESLQRTLEELQSYKQKHERYLLKQGRFTALQIPAKMQIESHMQYEHQRIREGTFNHKCQVRSNKSGSVLVCNLPGPSDTPPMHEGAPYDPKPRESPIPLTPSSGFNDKQPIILEKEGEGADGGDGGYILPQDDNAEPDDQDKEDETTETKPNKSYTPIYDWTDPSWPPIKSCNEYVRRDLAWDEFPSVYIDPEARGFSVRELLTTYIGVSPGEMHPLPWKPPQCDQMETLDETQFDSIPGIASRNTAQHKQDTHLQSQLLLHVNEGRVWPDDLGQRISTAIRKAIRQQDNDHLWVLYNLAGLFWRVNGDNYVAIECLRRCIRRVPAQHLDVPLVSLSNIMYRIGKLHDAVNLLIYALRVNNSEPATYLSMGNALQAQDNITGAVEFYNYAMVLHPQYKEAFHSLLVVKCSQLRNRNQEDNVKHLLNNLKSSSDVKDSSENVVENNPHDGAVDQVNQQFQQVDSGSQDQRVDDVAVDIVKDLIKQKSDANQLLKETTKAIEDLNNSNGREVDIKMERAHKLMENLSKIRNSLDDMVTKAALALSDKLGKSCETAVAEVDFKYSTNVDLLTQVSFPEADWTKIELANNEPLCILEQMPRYYDLTEVQSIHNPESLNVKKETCFEELLLKQSGSKSLIEVGRRLVHLLRTQPTWIPSYYAGYYWRATGDAKQTITCFMHSLSVAAPEHHPVVVAALSDFLATSGHMSDSLVMGRHLPELAPSPSNYYLIGDMFGANNQFITAADHYISATMDGDYKEARLKMKAAVCRHIAD